MNKLLVILVASAVLSLATAKSVESPFSSLEFDHYWSLADINEYMDELVDEFPGLASIENHGTTVEGRPIQAFVIRRGTTLKPTIVIDAGLRAREWLAPMAAMYIIHEIVEHDYEFDDLLDNIDFVVLPVSNPDGYVFSHENVRSWNKNRRPMNADCVGADVHRNFQYQFMAAADPCGENYPGPYYFSEAESRAVESVLIAYGARVLMYLSLQATGQQILIPYNYFPGGTTTQPRLVALANQVASAIAAINGRSYTVGVGGVVLGVEHGTPVDFAYGLRQIPLTFQWRLPSGGANGWDLPEDQLSSVLGETFTGFLVFARYVAAL